MQSVGFWTLGMLLASGGRAFHYDCYHVSREDSVRYERKMSLTVSPARADAAILGVVMSEPLGGAFDPDYQEQESIDDVRYGRNLVVEQALQTGGRYLSDGSIGGKARIEYRSKLGKVTRFRFTCFR